MRFHADLHVHSKHSRATSRDCDLEHLAWWASRKGIAVVATGDFTHPAWRAELRDKLTPAEPGLFRLRGDIEADLVGKLPAACRAPVRFMLSVEISTIYKKGDLTRKVHHLIYAPDFAAADRIAERLARIGNIASDGRPILGLDSRHLLEIVLESDPDAYLVPAHIWTPWFAVLGSRSGFDSIVECYGDLADRIFALETGLSSDPPMNWRLSILDRYRLVSNSDAHSPAKLGRETTLFDTDLDYFALRRALETGHGFVGTVEFFPEEGKYHLDGHRKCGVRLNPRETRENQGRCPACGEAVTVGVLHRVEALADRSEPDTAPPSTAGIVSNLVPLAEILSEIAGTGAASKAVERSYDRLSQSLGPELSILAEVPVDDIAHAESSLLAEAISRLRTGQVIREAGYDGEYGAIRLFEEAELKRRTAGGLLFDAPMPAPAEPSANAIAAAPQPPHDPPRRDKPPQALMQASTVTSAAGILARLDADQRAASMIVEGPVLIIAGPGSGKTRTLTHRIAHLIAERDAPPEACLAITFTRRAAEEMRGRLRSLLPDAATQISIHTFHSLGLALLRENAGAAGLHRGFRIASEAVRLAVLADRLNLSHSKALTILRAISRARRARSPSETDIAEVLAIYQDALALRNWVDFDDLIGLPVQILEADPALAAGYRNRFRWISVDEFQDMDEQQYRLLALIAPRNGNLCVIGDPNQAIYGFRGADAACFDRFRQTYPAAKTIELKRNYRSTGTIVAAASQVIADARPEATPAGVARDMRDRITIHVAPTDRAEAEFVVHAIERMIGGHSFFSIDSGRATATESASLSFADFAVLYRTDAQSAVLGEAFARSGMPFKKHSHAPLNDCPAVPALLQALDEALDDAGRLPLAARLHAAAGHLIACGGSPEPAEVERALQHLKRLAELCAGDAGRLADAVALASEADCWDPRADRVSLLTLHAAKGLEFPVVFIVGLEEGILPFRWSKSDTATTSEERRLLYVGMTRAMERLILSRARQRRWRGRLQQLPPSPFLGDIEEELLKHDRMPVLRRKAGDAQLKLL